MFHPNHLVGHSLFQMISHSSPKSFAKFTFHPSQILPMKVSFECHLAVSVSYNFVNFPKNPWTLCWFRGWCNHFFGNWFDLVSTNSVYHTVAISSYDVIQCNTCTYCTYCRADECRHTVGILYNMESKISVIQCQRSIARQVSWIHS